MWSPDQKTDKELDIRPEIFKKTLEQDPILSTKEGQREQQT